MSSEGYHESLDSLSEETHDLHRALISLQEELEAIDWYRQRADACSDEALRTILFHNMREEMEHASMLIEWLRRTNADFHRQLATYLFTEVPITEVEETAEKTSEPRATPSAADAIKAAPKRTVGSLKEN